MLKIANHGGKCCGVKTIHGFGYHPTEKDNHIQEPFIDASEPCFYDADGSDVSSHQNFFFEQAPKESTLARLDRYIAFLKMVRPKGVIEVTLSAPQVEYSDYSQIKLWHDDLISRGFKVTVPKFINSNSENYVQIYHLVTDEEVTYEDDDFYESFDPWDDNDEEED